MTSIDLCRAGLVIVDVIISGRPLFSNKPCCPVLVVRPGTATAIEWTQIFSVIIYI